MARHGKQIPSSLHAPIARRLLTESSRTGLADSPKNQQELYRILVTKKNHVIEEKILLVLLTVCVLVLTALLLL
jgi:hypothetical protein